MFAKNTLASAVAAAIGVSAVGVAQADTVFFPYAALSNTVTTVVSVINTTNHNWNHNGAVAATHLHYRFYYKTQDDLLSSCQEYNEYLPTSRNDIQTIDLGGTFASETAGVLFNDPSINNDWDSSDRSYAMGRSVMPARGYLTVDNSDTDTEMTLAGEAFVFEFGSGAAWGYQAKSSNDNDFRNAASESPSNVALMPFSEVITTFFVTPVSIDQHPDFANNYRARVEFVTTERGDLYDRDENLISGSVPKDVVCLGRVDASSLLSDGTAARLVDGGWGKLHSYRLKDVDGKWMPAEFNVSVTSGGSDSSNLVAVANRTQASDGAIVIKLEYNAGATFNGEDVGGTYNNGILFAPDANNPF